MNTFKQILASATKALHEAAVDSAAFEARLLLCHCFCITQEELILRINDIADEKKLAFFNSCLEKRILHTPLQYILGEWEFMGLPFYVSENVLIPRADTETLVIQALEKAEKLPSFSLLDMCCGSGCIGLSIKKLAKNSNINLTLADISDHALALCRKNAERLGIRASVIKSDFFDSINEKYDMIVCNPPYIPSRDIETLDEEVKHEPILALDGGADGLKFYRTLAHCYRSYLKKGGTLLMEVGFDEANDVIALFGGGYSVKDMSGIERVVIVGL
ncbi:MAG: peptide chain release factor N(5)-glutamine methyltransferase [Clostridia bacterium]|nr:peptide chain release factor N(5)-glutamine methyltransferase [Clostridia bacterium]